MPDALCSNCGMTVDSPGNGNGGEILCPQCGLVMEKRPAPGAGETLPAEYHRFSFAGTAGEYFRIWIVNVFLTIVTLGIYAAWAKVRTRRYFYANTHLGGHHFDYLGNPHAILKGNLIIGVSFIVYMLTQQFVHSLAGLAGLAFYLVVPYLVYKSLRFNARNSSYRNIRFRFLGTLAEGYKVYLLYAMLIPVTLGLIVPYWAFRRKGYLLSNLSFGAASPSFNGVSGPFYSAYMRAGLIYFGGMVLAGVCFFAVMNALGGGRAFLTSFVLFQFLVPALFVLCALVVQQYLYAVLTNYSWSRYTMGHVRFQSTMKARTLVLIQLTNIAAIIFSLGLAIPWAKVRRTRYVLEQMTVITEKGLDDFTGSVDEEQSALGETATDFFDLDIGL